MQRWEDQDRIHKCLHPLLPQSGNNTEPQPQESHPADSVQGPGTVGRVGTGRRSPRAECGRQGTRPTGSPRIKVTPPGLQAEPSVGMGWEGQASMLPSSQSPMGDTANTIQGLLKVSWVRQRPLTVLEVGGAEGLVSDTISWMASRSLSRCRALLMPIDPNVSESWFSNTLIDSVRKPMSF